MAAFSAFEAAKEKKEVLESGIVLARRFGFPVVVAAIAGSPAAAAGVRSDDVIEKVDGQLTRNMALWELESRLSGKAGRPRASRGRARRQAAPPHARHRAGELDAGRAFGRARGRRDGDPRFPRSRRARRGPEGDPEAARPHAAARPRPAQQRDRGRSTRRRARRLSSCRPARSASCRAAGSRRRRFVPSPASACTRAASSSSSTAGRPGRPSCSPPPCATRARASPARSSWRSTRRQPGAEDADLAGGLRSGRRGHEGRRQAEARRAHRRTSPRSAWASRPRS